MAAFLVLLLALATLGAIAVKPKLGALLVFPILYLYPHLYWFRLELTPWNIGFDDLFVCAFFLVVVVRRNLFAGTPFRIGLSVVGASTFLLVWTVAHLSGWAIMPDLSPQDVLKPILKSVIFVLFAYALVHTIDDERDLLRVSAGYVVSLTLAATTVILHQFFPEQMVIFTSERTALEQAWTGGVGRAVGSLVNPNTGCAILGMTVLFTIAMLRRTTSISRKAGLLFCVAIMLVGMVLTESRTGAAALGAGLLAMAVVGRARLYAWALLSMIALAVLVRPGLFLDFWERIAAAYNPEAGGVAAGSVQARIDAWVEYWRSATPQVWLLGQGRLVPTIQIGLHTHNSYISALFVQGIGGLVWVVLFFGAILWRSARLVRSRAEPYRSLGSAVAWGVLVWAVAGLALDMLIPFNPRFVYLFYAVLIERSYALLRERGYMSQFLESPGSLQSRLRPASVPEWTAPVTPPDHEVT